MLMALAFYYCMSCSAGTEATLLSCSSKLLAWMVRDPAYISAAPGHLAGALKVAAEAVQGGL